MAQSTLEGFPGRTRSQIINGYHYDPTLATPIAFSDYNDFPTRGDRVARGLFRDSHGQYFVIEDCSWWDQPEIVPASRENAERFYLVWSHRILDEF